MATPSGSASTSSSLCNAQKDLVRAVVSDQAIYPWNPADPAAQPYFGDLETVADAMELAQDTKSQWPTVANQASLLWAN